MPPLPGYVENRESHRLLQNFHALPIATPDDRGNRAHVRFSLADKIRVNLTLKQTSLFLPWNSNPRETLPRLTDAELPTTPVPHRNVLYFVVQYCQLRHIVPGGRDERNFHEGPRMAEGDRSRGPQLQR